MPVTEATSSNPEVEAPSHEDKDKTLDTTPELTLAQESLDGLFQKWFACLFSRNFEPLSDTLSQIANNEGQTEASLVNSTEAKKLHALIKLAKDSQDFDAEYEDLVYIHEEVKGIQRENAVETYPFYARDAANVLVALAKPLYYLTVPIRKRERFRWEDFQDEMFNRLLKDPDDIKGQDDEYRRDYQRRRNQIEKLWKALWSDPNLKITNRETTVPKLAAQSNLVIKIWEHYISATLYEFKKDLQDDDNGRLIFEPLNMDEDADHISRLLQFILLENPEESKETINSVFTCDEVLYFMRDFTKEMYQKASQKDRDSFKEKFLSKLSEVSYNLKPKELSESWPFSFLSEEEEIKKAKQEEKASKKARAEAKKEEAGDNNQGDTV